MTKRVFACAFGLAVLLSALISVFADDNEYTLRVKQYVADQGYSNVESLVDFKVYEDGRRVWCRKWDVPIDYPNDSEVYLLDSYEAMLQPEKYRVRDAGTGKVRKATAEEKASVDTAGQAAKAAKLKACENALIQILRDAGCMTELETKVLDSHQLAWYDYLDTQTENQQNKLQSKWDRKLKELLKRGGSESDIQWHP